MRLPATQKLSDGRNRAQTLWIGALALVIAVSAPAAFAHGSYEHIMGTVEKVANNLLTVKTAKGNVEVKLDQHTAVTKNNRRAQVADLKIGARVIVDMAAGSKDQLAHSVKIGAVSKAVDPHAHGSGI